MPFGVQVQVLSRAPFILINTSPSRVIFYVFHIFVFLKKSASKITTISDFCML